jgi:hypothetical protein
VARHGDSLDADVAAMRRELAACKTPDGDPTLLPLTLEQARLAELKRVFGPEFAR